MFSEFALTHEEIVAQRRLFLEKGTPDRQKSIMVGAGMRQWACLECGSGCVLSTEVGVDGSRKWAWLERGNGRCRGSEKGVTVIWDMETAVGLG